MRTPSIVTVLATTGAVMTAPASNASTPTTTAAKETAKAYMPYVWNTTATMFDFGSIHGLPIQARHGFFYVGGPADGVCPDYEPNCPSQNKTIITGPTGSRYDSAAEAFWLGILDPQGQEIVTNGDASLQYTQPQTDLGLVWGDGIATNTPFDVDFDDYSNQTVLRFNGDDFVACQVSQDDPTEMLLKPLAYIKYAYFFGNCTPFKMRLEETNAPAVLYYKGR